LIWENYSRELPEGTGATGFFSALDKCILDHSNQMAFCYAIFLAHCVQKCSHKSGKWTVAYDRLCGCALSIKIRQYQNVPRGQGRRFPRSPASHALQARFIGGLLRCRFQSSEPSHLFLEPLVSILN
jgi:hypothetical protein